MEERGEVAAVSKSQHLVAVLVQGQRGSAHLRLEQKRVGVPGLVPVPAASSMMQQPAVGCTPAEDKGSEWL